MKKGYLILFFSLLWIYNNTLTAQGADYLIYQGDTLVISSSPLEAYLKNQATKDRPNFDNCDPFYNWRNYVAWWKLSNDSLFLLKVTGCNSTPQLEEKATLATLFPNQSDVQAIFADWVNESIFNPYGEMLRYKYMDYPYIYEFDREFSIEKGLLKTERTYQNEVFESPFVTNPDSLFQFLSKNIRWETLPKQPEKAKLKVIVNFRTDSLGYISQTQVVRSCGPKYEAEALRLLQKMGKFSLLIRRGQVVDRNWYLPINFDQKVYQK